MAGHLSVEESAEPKSVLQKLKSLGPGLLWAGAAIGVSHLVQSTRAGAEFGFGLLWALIVANVFKFPFFEIGPRYVSATGKGLIEGYRTLGKTALAIFILFTLSTMFTIQAAVTVVTAGLAGHIFGLDLSIQVWTFILLLICTAILSFNRFSLLDKAVKVIIVVLTLSTIGSLIGTFLGHGSPRTGTMEVFNWGNSAHLLFLIGFMGWMPAPIDVSLWHSEWSIANNEAQNRKVSLKDSLFDFHIGYWGCALLAAAFLTLGARVMYGKGVELSASGIGFAGQLIQLYTDCLGSWATPIIAIAAFTTMFSTTLTCLDAFPRVLSKAANLLKPASRPRTRYFVILGITLVGTLLIVFKFMSSMKQMIQIATTLSFVTAPVLAWLNLKAMNHASVSPEFHIRGFRLWISYAGLVYLAGFALYFLWMQVG